MRTAKVLTFSDEFANEFERCCRDYKSLYIAVAWCGDPKHTHPYNHLDDFKGEIIATVGYSFNQTHPDAIQWLLDKAAAIRIFRREKGLFHPKLYLFTGGDRYALFAGSSNLTYGGFYENFEANVLIEGVLSTGAADVREVQVLLKKWRGGEFSFAPNKKWLNDYRKDHKRDRDAQRKAGIKTEALEEKNFGPNWLQKADWQTYYQEVIKGMRRIAETSNAFSACLTPLHSVYHYHGRHPTSKIQKDGGSSAGSNLTGRWGTFSLRARSAI
jgi:hypothetical protein